LECWCLIFQVNHFNEGDLLILCENAGTVKKEMAKQHYIREEMLRQRLAHQQGNMLALLKSPRAENFFSAHASPKTLPLPSAKPSDVQKQREELIQQLKEKQERLQRLKQLQQRSGQPPTTLRPTTPASRPTSPVSSRPSSPPISQPGSARSQSMSLEERAQLRETMMAQVHEKQARLEKLLRLQGGRPVSPSSSPPPSARPVSPTLSDKEKQREILMKSVREKQERLAQLQRIQQLSIPGQLHDDHLSEMQDGPDVDEAPIVQPVVRLSQDGNVPTLHINLSFNNQPAQSLHIPIPSSPGDLPPVRAPARFLQPYSPPQSRLPLPNAQPRPLTPPESPAVSLFSSENSGWSPV
jgi:hypothetical protein